ncbi:MULTISPECIES: 30S ribosomal protein S12 methylthiotransferase RimO [unclassified Candidatus Frackibacter]|uniref:30S ribosomal protein S12 methylthiotransferase RimO n=1 Tax=unclassified Candidatus Frackibacter TaxID=2648818 RepID=UPI000881401E|nr:MULTISPECIES: 30S ribosomal protein S12 methylthiotransferase RimO [unclassified Candidatus Frackibacter]SDB97042.1 SSU ribosomal protein S12P methylthiotransferase [Candidatus Frackibacter sp. WG11]SEM28646.1 SSU ribosomal protein S12P methylthiotransferase [Candidatus Frackibacter sp. WG12]SFL33528.1 SSU ribosomal protein S12P methylthiotransferase [Candidatus Frackibacter sp. WG13]
MSSVGLVSLGCPKNQVDSEIMIGLVEEAGLELVDDYEEAEVLIVNTCGFIGDAKEESIEAILQLAKYKEDNCEVLIVTGCLTQRYPEELKEEIPEIDAILGTGNFDEIVEVINEGLDGRNKFEVTDPNFDYQKELPRKRLDVGYTTYVKIAEGCNNRCSYCVIPKLRGDLRSRKIDNIVKEVKGLAKQGVKEVNIIAQDITKYGIDLYGESKLVELLKELVKIEDVKWFRLLYAYPNDFSDELIEMIAKHERICNYIDLPIQHADDRIREEMDRRGTKEEILTLISKLRDRIPKMTIRTSLIVGFPGETEKEFKNLLDFVQEAQFDRLGTFKYSQEEGTLAAKMPNQVEEDVKEERYERVMELQKEIALERNQAWIGEEVDVLVEEIQKEAGETLVIGRTERDAPEIDGFIYIKDVDAKSGDLIKVQVTDAYEYDLIGEKLE